MSFQTIEVEYSANCFDDNDDPIPAAEDGYDADNDYMCCLCNPRYERGECSYCKYRFTEFCKGSSMIISLSTQTLEAGCCQFVNKGLAPASYICKHSNDSCIWCERSYTLFSTMLRANAQAPSTFDT